MYTVTVFTNFISIEVPPFIFQNEKQKFSCHLLMEEDKFESRDVNKKINWKNGKYIKQTKPRTTLCEGNSN